MARLESGRAIKAALIAAVGEDWVTEQSGFELSVPACLARKQPIFLDFSFSANAATVKQRLVSLHLL
jgi:hypothetical protein